MFGFLDVWTSAFLDFCIFAFLDFFEICNVVLWFCMLFVGCALLLV